MGKRFVFVSGHERGGEIKSGGQRRYNELYIQLVSKGLEVKWINTTEMSFSSVLSSIKASAHRDDILLIFDERYLPYGVLMSIDSGSLVMFPRGDKLKHDYSSSDLYLIIKKWIIIFLYQFVDLFLFQSKSQMNDMMERYHIRSKTDVVYNNINTRWIQKLSDTDKRCTEGAKSTGIRKSFQVGFLGGDDPRKGLPIALQSMSLLNEGNASFKLLVAGETSRGKTYSMSEAVRYVGFLQDTSSFWNTIDLLWVPSRYDSFPNVCLEAIYTGTPFIISRSSITEEIFIPPFICDRSAEAFEKQTIAIINKDECHIERRLELLRNKYCFDWAERIVETIGDKV